MVEEAARRHLGELRFAEVTREGTQTDWSQLVEVPHFVKINLLRAE